MKVFLLGIVFICIIGGSIVSAIKISSISIHAQENKLPDFTLNYSLSIKPQRPDQTILVDYVSLEKPGFIRVQENNSDNITVGVSRILPPGTSTRVPIYIKSGLESHKSYTASLHRDNGNKLFDNAETDIVVSHSNGASAVYFYVL